MTDFASSADAARDRLRDLFPATPLQLNAHLSAKYGAEIWLKREDLSPVRSYKLRGALNAVGKALGARPELETFVCASAGNHAQGVAYACAHFNKRGVIFMPVTTPQQKIDKTRMFGGDWVEIRLVGDYFDDTLRASQAYCAEVQGQFLSPFDDLDVIEGQGSVSSEILADLPEKPDVLIVPVGGGGLSSSARLYFSEMSPETEIFFVEPEGGASLKAAVQAGKPTTINHVDTFVDGAAVARIGDHTFAALKGITEDHVLLAPEDRICTTILEMLNVEGIVLEPAGALALDVLPQLADHIKGKRVVCVTSGGNFDFERLPEVKERAQRFSGLKKYIILRLPQRPGALREFLEKLGPDDNITRFEYLKKSARNFGTVLLGIESSDPANFDTLFVDLKQAGLSFRDITTDETFVDFVI